VMLEHEYDLPYPRTPTTIVDAGAHIGVASLWFATHFPDATIVAVELERENFAVLVDNVAAYPNVHPIHAALWPELGAVSVVGRGETWTYHAATGASGPTVPAVTVSELMKRFGLDHIDLLKLDIEGAERDVLAAGDSWIGHVDAIVAELHDRYLPGCTRAFYAATKEFPVESRRGENVLVARSAGGSKAVQCGT
jgi:FkbM family methyltransferase